MNFSAILAVLRKLVRSGCKRRKDRFQRDYGTRVGRSKYIMEKRIKNKTSRSGRIRCSQVCVSGK